MNNNINNEEQKEKDYFFDEENLTNIDNKKDCDSDNKTHNFCGETDNNSKNHSKRYSKIIKILSVVLGIIIAFNIGFFTNTFIKSGNERELAEITKIIEQVGYIYDPVTGERIKPTVSDYVDALKPEFLDKYAEYYTREEFEREINITKGNHNNFGFAMSNYNNYITKVTGNSSVDRAGIKYGDKMEGISFDNGEKIPVSKRHDLNEALKNHVGASEIKVYITREGEFTEREFIIHSEPYKVGYVTYIDNNSTYGFREENGKLNWQITENKGLDFLDDKTAMINLSQFEGSAGAQFKMALDTMKDNNKSRLILDLRSNGGGDMRVLVEIAGYLMCNSGNNPVVAVSENNKGREYFRASSKPYCDFIEKMSVIANDGTASASECLMGALLTDNKLLNMDRVVIEKNVDGIPKTYGKGIMQTTFSLMSGGAFKLTTAKIYWPDEKTCIHNKGIIAIGENGTEFSYPATIQAYNTLL